MYEHIKSMIHSLKSLQMKFIPTGNNYRKCIMAPLSLFLIFVVFSFYHYSPLTNMIVVVFAVGRMFILCRFSNTLTSNAEPPNGMIAIQAIRFAEVPYRNEWQRDRLSHTNYSTTCLFNHFIWIRHTNYVFFISVDWSALIKCHALCLVIQSRKKFIQNN